MGKQGPCYHCGVTNTPLWRNGPPEKPVLCNACGSRWRTKGTLVNYVPLHCRAEADEYEDHHKVPKPKMISLKKRDEKLKKRKMNYENTVVGKCASNSSQGFQKSIDEDTSNRSSSGSAVSNSESCAQFSADASDLTDPAQSVVWEAQVPSKKRTFLCRPKPSSVEKLTQDLYTILQEQQSSNLSGSYEEELLFESDKPMVSVEIGHGSVLMKHPSSLVREEESEASSLSVENKPPVLSEAYSKSAPLFGCNDFKDNNILYHGSVNYKNPSHQMVQQEPEKRDKSIYNKMQLIWNQDSPLCDIDLNDVINFEVLVGHMTSEEQQQLLRYLPSSDKSQFPGSLKCMFSSSSFKENLSSFQQLLSEGVFGNSSSGVKAEDLRTLKRLAVSNLTKSKWLILYNKLKDSKSINDAGGQIALEAKSSSSKNLGNPRSHEELNQNTAERTTVKSLIMKAGLATKETVDTYGSYITPRNLFSSPTEDQRLMIESHQFPDESTEEDLLLDVPSNGFFPQAELLPVSSFASLQTSAKKRKSKSK
ncbi:hypothetical protein V2J09_009948 [Rumex salicifolius]